jgi:hypothetical protein
MRRSRYTIKSTPCDRAQGQDELLENLLIDACQQPAAIFAST